ncbi:glycosyltransferase family 8 protein [Hydnum rufescens UP504]|uniref:glycogenin glucosyltransferase n=1 Tax=Hydnum rufescens UP504 TaxID=1448309 RepID=A0A9P6DX68_9AGAM|nr:glycosyltransferase family 8 protein [Hydnum rufescens UP504]
MTRFAFVTLVTSDLYAKGALVIAAALRELHPTPTAPEVPFDTACIVTPETVDVSTVKALRKAFDAVVGVEVIDEDQASRLMLLGRPDLKLVLTKLHVFRLTQYEKIIFLDADVLPVRTLSHLFTLPHEFSAVPDVGWPDIFNSGVMVLSPGEDKFNALMALVKSKASWDGGDQGLLNEWRGEDWNRLSFIYNTTPTAAYIYAPAYERFGSKISAIHFIGPNKPWASEAWRPPFARSSSTQTWAPGTQQSYAYESLVDRWFDVYDRHFRASPVIDQPPFTVGKYEAAWDAGSTGEASSGRLDLDELKRLALEGSSVIPGGPSGEAEYRSLPLEGRLALMRSQSPPPPPPPPALPTSIDIPVSAVDHSAPLVDESAVSTPRPGSPSYESVAPIHRPDTDFEQTSAPPLEPLPFVDQTSTPSLEAPPFVDQTVASPSLPTTIAMPLGVPSAQAESQAAPSGPVSAARSSLDGSYESSPPPPPSPPLIAWNPAVEPPPSAPPLHAPQEPIPSHFTNVWDLPPAHRQDSHHRSDTHDHSFQHISDTPSQAPVHAEDFFPVPSPPTIPARLVHQGTYADVAHTRPDYSKVKSVFPWEEQPRRAPERVFPITDPPPPGMPFLDLSKPLLPLQQPTPENPSLPPDDASHPQVSPSPPMHHGPAGSLVYANVWDNIPSIQNYVSKLVKPVPSLTVW